MARSSVAVIKNGGANIASLHDAFERLGSTATFTRDPEVIRSASHVILPGVGSAADAMQKLKQDGLDEVIAGLSQPVLGICLGMQLLARSSEEQNTACLDIVPSDVAKLPISPRWPVPNTGWCAVKHLRNHRLFHGIADGSFFYFVHSYALPVDDFTIATAEHAEPFAAVLASENFFGGQFHPEKSSEAGAKFLQNFLQIRI